MSEEVVDGQSGYGKRQANAEKLCGRGVTHEQADAYACFPSEEECALRGTTLTMAAELDEEKQKARAYQPETHSQEHRGQKNSSLSDGLLTDEQGSYKQEKTCYGFTLEVGVGKNKTLGQQGEKESRHHHGVEHSVALDGQQKASYGSHEQQIKYQRPCTGQKETIERKVF